MRERLSFHLFSRTKRGPINYFAETHLEQERIREAREAAEDIMKQHYPHEPSSSRRMRKGIAALQLVNLYQTSGKYSKKEVDAKYDRASAKVIELFRRS